MRLDSGDLDEAVRRGIVSPEQADALRTLAVELRTVRPAGFTFQHLAYYLGGLMVIGAMGWYVTNAWDAMGPAGYILTAAGYAGALLLAARALWSRPGGRVPGGLLATLAVCMTPIGVYGLQLLAGWWPQGISAAYPLHFSQLKGCWLAMELATIAAGLLALRRFRFPFLTAPVGLALWFLSMDLAQLLFGQPDFTQEQRRVASLWFGLALLAASYLLDRRTREDYAFWGYLLGLLSFWGALSTAQDPSEWSRLGYCGINVLLLVAGIVLERRVFLVFGGVGVGVYLGHLAHRVFRDSLFFPFALSAIGLGIMALGWVYQRNGAAVDAMVLQFLPERVRRALPRQRGGAV
ncbi:MAG: hypothetical protein AUJ49_09025 [Desulfovibrionaceae bacterium CG1_02_65_16]|nr:MAG: hypothetical protein AUJ49_09025 [Desulfovibrionaceae bacterium CG1_02_65_16]